MMQDELDILRQASGDKNPFIVPEGYFDSLTDRIMQNLPQKEEVKVAERRTIRRPYLRWAAVSLATIGIGLTAYLSAVKNNGGAIEGNPAPQQTAANISAEDNLDQMADYMMLDQEDLYAYLAYE